MLLTPPMEDYLRAIHDVRGPDARAATSRIADELGVAQASVTKMVKKLATAGLVDHEAYRGVALTDRGEKVAVEVIRHHRLLELYLSQELGLSWDKVHAEADRLEHHISEELEAAIAERLGHPTVDPHGDPIPTVDLEWPDAIPGFPLTDATGGAVVQVERVTDQAPETLRALSDAGVVPGATVEVVAHKSAVGVSQLRVAGEDIHLASAIAASILVKARDGPVPEPSEVRA